MDLNPSEDNETDEVVTPDEWLETQKPKLDIGPWARFPNKFFGSGMARKVGPSASVLYFALCENANRNREPSNTFKTSDKALASETGLSPRTMRNVRTKLLENGLVAYSREPGQNYTYTLLRQELKWLSRSERPRLKKRPRAMAVAKT
jgi:DNA-binding transcriptional ArsR family regulator